MPAKPPVLIIALSARALAASAKRAGYRPIVVDCFGDEDLAADAKDFRTLPAPVRTGFDSRALLAAVDDLKTHCDETPIGVVLGSGFEDRPALISKLAQQNRLLGTDAETVRALKDPGIFFQLLDRLAIPHPEIRLQRPDQTEGWLRKRIGGSGGEHIRPCRPTTPNRRNRYFQHHVKGEAISVLAIVSKAGTAFALSRQWVAPSKSAPFRYGGAVSHVALTNAQEREILEAAFALTEAADLQGLVSIDFIVNDEAIYCLEINPRPSAALDVHDDVKGSLFEAHVLACHGQDPAAFLTSHWQSEASQAAAYLYADRGPLMITLQNWPDWVRDRPRKGTAIAPGQPVASVHATANTAEIAEQTCRDRLATLEKMLYESQNGKETSI